jgi:hypothetical protein
MTPAGRRRVRAIVALGDIAKALPVELIKPRV